jgi:hypothetical protein
MSRVCRASDSSGLEVKSQKWCLVSPKASRSLKEATFSVRLSGSKNFFTPSSAANSCYSLVSNGNSGTLKSTGEERKPDQS